MTKILIVDDDPDLRTYLSTFLTDNGYEIITAEDGDEGMVKSKKHNPDLITLDMKDCEKVIPEAYKKLSDGGWLVVYSPHVEQVTKVLEEMKKSGFKNCNCVENIVREWQSNYGFTRPKSQGLMHTGWLSFGKK